MFLCFHFTVSYFHVLYCIVTFKPCVSYLSDSNFSCTGNKALMTPTIITTPAKFYGIGSLSACTHCTTTCNVLLTAHSVSSYSLLTQCRLTHDLLSVVYSSQFYNSLQLNLLTVGLLTSGLLLSC